MAPGSCDDRSGVSDLFGNLFSSSNLSAPIEDGMNFTDSTYSSNNPLGSLRNSFAEQPASALDNSLFHRNSYQIHESREYHNHEDVSHTMGYLPPELGSYFERPNDYTIPDDGLFDDIEWNHPEQLGSYTLDQAISVTLSTGDQHGSTTSEGQNIARSCHPNISNEVSNPTSWEAHAPQTTTYSLSQEAIIARQVSISLTQTRNVPRSMATHWTAATRITSGIERINVSVQEDESRCPEALDTHFRTIRELPSNWEPSSRLPIMSADSYVNHRNMTPMDNTPSPSSFTANSRGSSPYSTSQLAWTPQSNASSSKRSHDSFVDSPVELPLQYSHRKKQRILPAPVKAYPEAPQTSQTLVRTPLQPVYGPKKSPSKQSDRRRFTVQERKIIRKVREMGSCFGCKANKSQCDTNKICKGCLQTAIAKHIKLDAGRICIRDGILYYREQFRDFFDTKGRIDLLPKTLRQPCRTLIIGDRVILNDTDNAFFPREIALSVRVREYGTCANDNRLVFSEGSSRSALTYYAIDRSTFPTVLQLDNWGRNLLLEESMLPGFRPYIMDKFLFAYLHAEPERALLHRNLVDSTIRLVSLSTWLFEVHPVIAADNFENANLLLFDYDDKRIERRLAEVARSQLFLIALQGPEGFEPTEKNIFSEVDKLLRRSGGCSPESALIVGLCLRRISLLYRSSVMRYRKFTIDSVIKSKLEKSKAMYELLTTAYSHTYRGANSPYSKKWKFKDHAGAFGHDDGLSKMFLEVVTYEQQYCEKYLDDEYDAHFKQLFLERGEGGGPRK